MEMQNETSNITKAVDKLLHLDNEEKQLLENDILKAFTKLQETVIFLNEKYSVSLVFDISLQLGVEKDI